MSLDEIILWITLLAASILLLNGMTGVPKTEIALCSIYAGLYFLGIFMTLQQIPPRQFFLRLFVTIAGIFVFFYYTYVYASGILLPDEIILRTILLGGGVYGTVQCGHALYHGFTISHWPTATATLIQSQTCLTKKTLPDSRSIDVCEVQLQYEYQIQGKTFQSTRYAPDQEQIEFPLKPHQTLNSTTIPPAQQKAEQYLKRYPLTASVQIHYHPDQPEIAYLRPRYLHFSSWAQSALGLLLSLYIFGLLIFS